MLTSALAPSTLETYRRAWATYDKFSVDFLGQSTSVPLNVSQICLFVAFLQHEKFAPKTISTYLSALSFVHKMQGHTDPTSAFLVSKLVAGAYRLNNKLDVRLPLTVPILNRLLASLHWITTSVYDRFLFQAMYLLAFNAFARIGEVTVKNSKSKVLQMSDIDISSVDGKPDSVAVTFRHYKHNLPSSPYTISFGHGPTTTSAVQALAEYIALRGEFTGPLFCLENKNPVNKLIFDRHLHRSLSFCHLDSSRYKGHSFRIGAATFAAESNVSDARIRALGRWSSNAFRKYIRISGTT